MSAADKVRKAAQAATPGPWRYNPNKAWRAENGGDREEFVGAGPTNDTICVAATGPEDHPQSMADAAYIALMDPTVAAALADLLDSLSAVDAAMDDVEPNPASAARRASAVGRAMGVVLAKRRALEAAVDRTGT